MSLTQIFQDFLTGMKATTALEYIAVTSGIASVFLSRAENILVYPVGLVNTIIYIYLSLDGHLLGEASVNIWYTALSIYGWVLWSKRKGLKSTPLQITFSTPREWLLHLGAAALLYGVLFILLTKAKAAFYPGAIPWADAFASATAYTGMWLMARKKVDSWWWWIATNAASIPLYFVKGYVITSVQFVVFLVLAIMGLIAWGRKGERSLNGFS